jgi:hypothetical protein
VTEGEGQCAEPDSNPPQPTYEYFNVNTGAVANAIASSGTVSVPFYGGSRTLRLFPYIVVAPGTKISIDDGSTIQLIDWPITTGIGYQDGIPDSLAVVTVFEGYFDAMLYLPMGDEWYFDSNIPGQPISGNAHRGWNLTIDPLPLGEYQPGPPGCEGGGGEGASSGSRGSVRPEPLHNLIAQNLVASGDAEYVDLFSWCPLYINIPAATCAANQMATEVTRINVVFNGLETGELEPPW